MLKLIFCAFVSCMRPGQNLLKAKLRPVRPAPGLRRSTLSRKARAVCTEVAAFPPARCCSCLRCRRACSVWRLQAATAAVQSCPAARRGPSRPALPPPARALPARLKESWLPRFHLFFHSFGKDRRENTAGVAGGGVLVGCFQSGAGVTWCRWVHRAAFVSVWRVRWCAKQEWVLLPSPPH